MSNDDLIEHRQHSVDGDNWDGATRTLQLLRAGLFQFGIFADEIAAVAAWREPTPLPHAPNSVLGVVSIQGRMLTVLDLATLPDREYESPAATVQHLVALRGDEQLALAVDELGETIEFADSDFDITREIGETFILGVVNRDGTDIFILDSKELFPTAIQGRERRRRRF